MTDDEIIEVVRAHKEGKQIECRFINETRFVGTDWFPAADQNRIQWNFVAQEYRVKPKLRKPREWWVFEDTGGRILFLAGETGPKGASFRVREVLE